MNLESKKPTPNPEQFGATDRTVRGSVSDAEWDAFGPNADRPQVKYEIFKPVNQADLQSSSEKLIHRIYTPSTKELVDHIVKPLKVDFKFDEDLYVDEILTYIKKTYTEHYAGRYQATDMIIDAGHGEGFTIGSIMKYAKRYGKKNGKNRKDLMKIIHYAIIALHIHDGEPRHNGD